MKARLLCGAPMGQALLLFALVVACQPALSAGQSDRQATAGVETIPDLVQEGGRTLYVAPEVAGFESDYSVLMDRLSTDDGNSASTLSEWQALGYDEHSFIAAPPELFVGGDDFHLRPGSPAIDAGLALPDVVVDLEGRSRPQGSAYDVGALEFVEVGAESMVLPLVMRTVRREYHSSWTTWEPRYCNRRRDKGS